MLALGMIAALAMPGTAQATPQLGDLGVKQSMSVKASNGESLEGKDLRAIQLATYTAASVDGNTIVGYDLTTNTAWASDITAAAKAAASASVQSGPASRRAVISLDSPSTKAEQQFRMAIVALDGIPGNQVEGISPLYHVSQLDGLPDKMAAVMQISTRMGARDLIETLGNVEASISGDLDLDLIDMEGVTCDEPDCKVPWPTARIHAAVLAPWLDMDPDARLGKDPVSFLLAMAPDTAQVGLLTDNWIIGGEL